MKKHLILLACLTLTVAGCHRETVPYTPPPPKKEVMTQKTIPMPRTSMEARGKLAKSAAATIQDLVEKAQAARGSVRVLYPPKAPKRVIQELEKLGVKVEMDNTLHDYEVVLAKPAGRP